MEFQVHVHTSASSPATISGYDVGVCAYAERMVTHAVALICDKNEAVRRYEDLTRAVELQRLGAPAADSSQGRAIGNRKCFDGPRQTFPSAAALCRPRSPPPTSMRRCSAQQVAQRGTSRGSGMLSTWMSAADTPRLVFTNRSSKGWQSRPKQRPPGNTMSPA